MLLRQSNVKTNILLYAHLYGNHEYSAIPFFPIGMEDLIHENPIRRKIWDEHAMKGWVLGTSDKHYRCWRLWIKRTRATIISGMVFFKHKYILNPTVTAAEAVLAAAQDMAAVLRKKLDHHLGEEALTALANLQLIFVRAAEQKKTTDEPTQHASPQKLTYLTQPKPAKLIVASSSPQPRRDVTPPPRLALTVPHPRVDTPPYLSPPAPS